MRVLERVWGAFPKGFEGSAQELCPVVEPVFFQEAHVVLVDALQFLRLARADQRVRPLQAFRIESGRPQVLDSLCQRGRQPRHLPERPEVGARF